MKILLAFTFFVSALPLKAQNDDLPDLVSKAVAAMNAGEWEQALGFNSAAVERFGGESAPKLHGAQFGVIWFRKGLCELKLRKWTEAAKSFETCYKDFPNAGEAAGGNVSNKMALLKWGDAAMGAGDYKLAITQWQKFIGERDKDKDKYPQGAFHINMAICNYRLGKISVGNDHLEIAINNKANFPTPDAAIVSGFQDLVAAAIAKKDEQVLSDFITKNRKELIIQPLEMQRFSKLFMKLAGDAISANMLKTALSLYQFVPSTEAVIADLRNRISAPGISSLDKKAFEAELAALESERAGNNSVEMIKLAALAYIHESSGDIRSAYDAYLELESSHSKAEQREENLYQLVRTSTLVSEHESTRLHGMGFLELFPDSPRKADVRKLLLSSLFSGGKYESCIEIATDIITQKKAPEDSPEHDLALFVLGGSYFHLGNYAQSATILDQHVEKFPGSMFAHPASYFQAASAARLQLWAKAAPLLDAFLIKYRDADEQAYTPLALYDRATCHHAEKQPDGALEKLGRLIAEFPDSAITDQAYILRGRIHQSASHPAEAGMDYIKALEIAESKGRINIGGQALYQLVALLGEKKPGEAIPSRSKEAVLYADKYWEKYAVDSPYRAGVAVAQLGAFNAVGRGEEALSRLQSVISNLAEFSEANSMEEAINAYSKAYLEKHSPEELKEHYYQFPLVGSEVQAARALLRIAVIGEFEKIARNKADPSRQGPAQLVIQGIYQDLKTGFDPKALSNFILVKLGDHLRTETSAPHEAFPYYDELLSREDGSHRFRALLGRADIHSRSIQEADLAKAHADLDRVYKESHEKSEQEFAFFRAIEVLMKKGDFAQAAAGANTYLAFDPLKAPGFGKFTPQIELILASSFHERGMIDEAISNYAKVWSAHTGYITISAHAVESWMDLLWKRNSPSHHPGALSDRQAACKGGAKYLELTGHYKDQLAPEELAFWQRVEKAVLGYEADPDVKSIAEAPTKESAVD
ncbi:MAG: tetratricopeptide repeat protein [Armatimonadetes bacterium]|nr:tetratricopeptide repeat protein [Akkermansiaceae bacterium]